MDTILAMLVMTLLSTVVTSLLPYIWSLPFLVLSKFVTINEIESQHIPAVMSSLKPKSSITKSDGTPSGIIFGKWYGGLIMPGPVNEKGTDTNKCFIVCPAKKIKEALTNITIDENISDQCIIESYGNAFWNRYKSENFSLRLLQPTRTQDTAIQAITNMFYERRSISVCVFDLA